MHILIISNRYLTTFEFHFSKKKIKLYSLKYNAVIFKTSLS